jgi:PHD/YefM family antitoxin component YafN of YafNO toxin-antitoxin module
MLSSTTPSTVAQSRQNLAALIAAAQDAPQVITRHDKPVAVMVSPDFFTRAQGVALDSNQSFFNQLMQARKQFPPSDDKGLPPQALKRRASWQRANPFVDSQ